MNPIEFILRTLSLCYKYRASISSWGRTPKHNKDVGGVPNSCHMLWIGCDVVLDVMVKNTEFEADARSLKLNPILEGDHYHLQPLDLS